MAGAGLAIDPSVDPNVELLADIPIAGPEEDLLERQRIAVRITELAMAPPATDPMIEASPALAANMP